MSRLKQLELVLLFTLGAAAASGTLWAQDTQQPDQTQPPQEPTRPKPAARGIPGLDDSSQEQQTDQWQPDISPATGLQTPTLGSPELRHSYWVPGAQYGATLQSSPYGTGSNSGWSTTQYLGANLSLFKAWSESTLALNWSGGGVITDLPGQDNGWFAQLGASQNFMFRRWQWQWSDQFSYLPQTGFGFGGGTGLSTPGVGGTLAPITTGGLGTSQSIFSAVGPRYSNTFTLQGTYLITPRQSITVGGMEGLLRFTQAGSVDSDTYLGSVGYNYSLTKEDSIGVVYRFNSIHFIGQPQAYGDSSVSVAYQRKITARMALLLNAGPDFISYRVPLGGASSRTSVMANATLRYGFKNGSVSVNYYHGLSAGSGVLIGGDLDQVTLSVGRQLTRVWSVNGNFGYASNRSLNNAATTGFPSYDSYFFGGGVNRPFGRNLNLAVGYQGYVESGGPSTCIGVGCNANQTVHTINLSLNWHTRPFVIE